MQRSPHGVSALFSTLGWLAGLFTTACGGGGSPGAGAGGNGGAPGSGSGTLAAKVCPAGITAAGSPVPAGASPARIATVPPKDAFNNNGSNRGIVEGVVWTGDALYLSEIASGTNPPPSRILKIVLPDTVSIVSQASGTNGLALDGKGGLLGASHGAGGIVAIALPSGATTNVVTQYENNRFDSPNDLAVRGDGNIYFSDPDYQAPATRPQQQTRVYRLAPGANAATVVDASRRQPNGVTLSLDENTLFVSGTDGIFSYPVMGGGEVGGGTRISTSSGDGMGLDCAGRLYVASGAAVLVLDPNGGAVIATISVPGVQSATNVAFGGAERKTLFITALGSGTQMGLFQMGLSVPGLPY